MIFFVIFFFFSSRRRHTRLQGDWSSDVCSSDLFPAHPSVRRALRSRQHRRGRAVRPESPTCHRSARGAANGRDRKSTRLNSSHLVISYAVFCLKKKN